MSALFSPTALVVPFENLRMTDVEVVGGKNASLGEMISQLPQGVRVPTGFATTAHAFREFLAYDGLADRISAKLKSLDTEDVRALAQVGAEIRAMVEAQPFPADLQKAIADEFAKLSAGNPAAYYWINNAGRATSRFLVPDLPEDLVHTLIDGNLKGTVFGSQVAMAGFRRQGFGALYNMLGGTYEGKRLTPNMGVYSATKAGDWMLTKYLVAENKDPSIIAGAISPCMLITENWFDEQKEMTPEDWQKIRPVLNILCDYVETSTPWLVEQVLANRTNGKRIAWMTTGKLLGRFAGAKLLGRKRDLFSRFGL